ncbi:lipopolysaccharide assembly protein LapB [Shewanella sp. NIFS-20-20]|uniref:tetratricopeptide repeat protein n=1 Tax=Shewanella sp. NIFS-20-20 TaxID=2853806 RepID=UPI001C45E246|nr:tetratricopeptide repeat protein [Shewanella sp. NIFS-20-20]MBV7315962.1 tetratricopeptide repeat protein [Shewanella sp. NIFS-20-20]
MRKVSSYATALLFSLCGGSLVLSPLALAKGDCPIDNRKSQAVGERSGKKVQRSYEAYTNGSLDEAIGILLEVNPSDTFDKAYVARMLGNFYAEKGDMSASRKYLKQAVDADVLSGTDHAGTLRLYADILLQEKQFKEAIPYYYKWIDFTCKTNDATVYKRIGVAYTELEQWDKVLEVANKGIELADKPDQTLYQMKLTAYYNKKQYKNAVSVLETMIPIWQTEKRLWVQLAQFYVVTESYDKALATYDLAYKNGFLETEANITRLAQLLNQKESPYRAAQIYQKNLDNGMIPKNEKSYKLLATFYQNAKESSDAAKYYGLAAEAGNDGELYLRQGRLLSLEQEYKPAIAAFKKALDTGIKNPGEAQFELALAYLNLKQYKPAYQNALLAAKDKKTERSAKSYISYIKEKARINNITL